MISMGEESFRCPRTRGRPEIRGRLLLFPLLALATGCTEVQAPLLPPLAPEVMRFGLTGGIVPPPDLTDNAFQGLENDLDDLGTMWVRHPGKGTSWPEIQPHRDAWDFERLDGIVHGLDRPWVLTVYAQYGYVYPFGGFSLEEMGALKDDGERIQYIAEHTIDMTDEQQRADAEAYVKALVNRYEHQVRFWEIGNEGLTAAGVFDIVENTHRWIKEADPDAVVLPPAVGGNSDEHFEEGLAALDTLLGEGAGEFFDVGQYHYYGPTDEDLVARLTSAQSRYADLLEDHGLDRPIWVTETSTSSWHASGLSGRSSKNRQACDVIRRFVAFTAHGAQRVFWLSFKYGVEHRGDNYGGCDLFDDDMEPKPSWHAMQLVVDKIGHFQEVETILESDVNIYRYEVIPGEDVYVVWAQKEDRDWYDLTAYGIFEGQLDITPVGDDVVDADLSRFPLSYCPVFIEPTYDDAWLEGD